MKNFINKTNFTMKELNFNNKSMRGLFALVLMFSLAIGNAWAAKDHKTKLAVAGGDTGKGLVYAANADNVTVAYGTGNTTDELNTSSSNNNESHTHYAWASPVRGYTFGGWTKSSASTSSTSNPYSVTVTAGKDQTVTGTLTASWTKNTSYNVTYNVPSYGAYSVTYTGLKYNSSNKTIETGEVVSKSLNGSSSAQTVESFVGDEITLTSTDGIFLGWYNNASGTGTALSTNSTYTFTYASTSPTSIYAIYDHVDTYYGKLTGSIGSSSVPAGGTICVSNAATDSPTYSDETQQVTHSSIGSTSLKYYLYAKPNDGRYVLRGWYADAACTTPASVTKVGDHYEYTLTSSSTNEASPTTGNIYAAFDFNLYYLQVDAKPATLGLGKVLVKDQAYAAAPDYTLFTDSASQFGYVLRTPAMTKNIYLYAKPKYGYKFSGWYDNAACTGAAKSTANPYTYAATGTSMDPAHPTITTLYAKFVEDATTVNVTYNRPDQTKGEYTASVLDIQEIDDEFVWAFTEVFTSVGKTANTEQAQHKTDVLRLEAACKAGYGVTSWTEGSTTKTTPSHIYQTTGNAEKTLSVAFGDAQPFMVSANNATTGTRYATLADALANRGSNTKITVVQNAYVPAIEGGYTIPSGVTLLIPNDENYAIMTKGTDIQENWPALSSYIKLTIGEGVDITVNGNICIAASQRGTSSSNPGPGMPCGAYGSIDMSQGGHITINNGANLYAFGFIFGGGDKTSTGTITIKSGGTVYEDIIVNDMPGGGGTAACVNGTDASNNFGLFPFSQYFIQNIEPKMTIEHGGKEKVVYDIQSGFGGQQETIDLIGNANTFLFQTTATGSSVTKWYDYSRDYQCYEVTGSMTMNKISINAADILTMSSDKFVLPLNNNMDITVKSGATMTLPYDVKLLPGAKLKIEEGATVEVKKGFYVYDYEDWDFFGGSASKSYAQTVGGIPGHTVRTVSSKSALGDASLVVNGTLKLSSSAAFYTTSHGSSVTSDGTGQIIFEVAGKSDGQNLYERWGTYGKKSNGAALGEGQTDAAAGQVLVGSYTMTLFGVTVKGPYYVYGTPVATTPAKLLNGDGSYVLTANAAKNDKFIYSKNLDKWLKNPKTVTWNANGGTSELESMAYSEGAFVGVLPTATREGYTFNGWFTQASGGSQISETTKVTDNVTYYAHWTPIIYNITYKDQGKAAFSGTHIDTPNAHPTTHTYGTATTLNGVNNKANAQFDGWHTISNCKAESKVTSLGATAVTKDITLYAKWIPLYTLTFEATEAGYGSFSQASVANVPEGSAVTTSDNTLTVNGKTVTASPSAETAQYTYAFDHWNNVPATVTTAATIQAVFTRATRSYNVTFNMKGHGSAIDGQTKDYGSKVDQPSDPSETGYTFGGWYKEEACTNAWNFATDVVTAETPLYAKWTVNKYAITWVDGNGTTLKTEQVEYGTTPAYTGATPTKTATDQYTYTFNNTWSPALVAVTEDATYTAQFNSTVNKYTITWVDDNDVAIETDENVAYGATPHYDGETPTKTADARYTYTFANWTPAMATVTGNATYKATFDAIARQYTITWKDEDGSTLDPYTTDVQYGVSPTHVAPSREDCSFTGWKASDGTIYAGELPSVGTNEVFAETYTAQYACTQQNIVVVSDESKVISNNTTTLATTVHVSGSLSIEGGKTLKTTTLFLEASPDGSGQISGNIDAEEAYLDYNLGSSQSGLWYDIAVPWKVDATNGVYLDGDTKPKQLNKDFYLIYYNGELRARENRHTNECWQFVGRESTPDNLMHPGRLYMIYLPKAGVKKLRFKRYGNGPIVTPEIQVYEYNYDASIVNRGWNGIANPAIYKAYLNAGANTVVVNNTSKRLPNYGQKYNPVDNKYVAFQMNNTAMNVSQPVFVQVDVPGEETSRIVDVTTSEYANPAPMRKALVHNAAYEVQISAGADYTDRIYLQSVEGKEDSYRIGLDLSKAGTSNKVAQMWVNRYDTKLCVNTTAPVGTTANYPLGISVPSDGTYEITSATEMQDGQEIYVTYNGRAIWNLAYGPYAVTLNKGTYNEYGLKLVQKAPTITTGVETVSDERLEGSGVRKVLIDDHIYIIREGAVYTINGQQVK